VTMPEFGPEEINTETPGFRLFAKIGLALDSISARAKAEQDRDQRRLNALPVYQVINRFNTVPSVATEIVSFDGPENGREWHVRLLTAFASPVASNAATVSWYVGQQVPGDAAGQLPVTMKRWEFTTIPGQVAFSSSVFVVRAGDNLLAGLTGVPAASRIALTAYIQDQPLWAERYSVAVG